MARSVLAIHADVGAPFLIVIMSTDAMGADGTSSDRGGYGVVACDVRHERVLDCLNLGSRQGKALSREMVRQGRASPHDPLTRLATRLL